MKNLLAVLALIIVGIAAFGFYRGWFEVSTVDAEHKSNVTFSVDQDKVHGDEQKLKALGHSGSAPPRSPTNPTVARERTGNAHSSGLFVQGDAAMNLLSFFRERLPNHRPHCGTD